MPSLILHPSTIAQWHTLLHDAQRQCAIHLKEDLESYLVFLLMRFTDQPALASSILGLDFLHSCQSMPNKHRQQLLKDVGDKCLLFAGLFPGRAKRRRVRVSYFVNLGRTAYSTLFEHQFPSEPLFSKLSNEFTDLMDVLQSMRHDPNHLDLLSSFELWHETGSKLALKHCLEARGCLTPRSIHSKNH